MERESLYAAICANPRDDLPKLVFADWLDEQGGAVDRAHAELIRIQCEWESHEREYERALEPYRLESQGKLHLDPARCKEVGPDANRALALLARAQQLAPVVPDKPNHSFRLIEMGCHFSGRITALKTKMYVTVFRTSSLSLKEILCGFPVRNLTINPFEGADESVPAFFRLDAQLRSNIIALKTLRHTSQTMLNELFSHRGFDNLTRLASQHIEGSSDLFSILDRNERFDRLDELELRRMDDGHASSPSGIPESIARNLRFFRVGTVSGRYATPVMILPFAVGGGGRLEELELRYSHGTTAATELLSQGAVSPTTLVKISLARGDLNARSACELLTSPRFPALRQLDLSGNVFGDLIGKRLQMANDYPELDSLDMSECGLSTDGLTSLVNWPGFVHLRKLMLNGNAINHEGISALGSADAPNLRTLGLRSCNLHGSHVRELVRSRFVRSLWSLDLRGNHVDDAFVRALIETPFLDAQQCLLVDIPETDPGHGLLKARFGERFQSAS